MRHLSHGPEFGQEEVSRIELAPSASTSEGEWSEAGFRSDPSEFGGSHGPGLVRGLGERSPRDRGACP